MFSVSEIHKNMVLTEASLLPDGYKIKRDKDYLSISTGHKFRLALSIIIINRNVYWLGREVIGKGGFGRVKSALCLNDNIYYVIKIESSDEPFTTELNNESAVLSDLSLKYGSRQRQPYLSGYGRRYKNYTVMPDLGRSLSRIFTLRATIPNAERFQIAIEACWEVAQLHEGLLSQASLAYEHGDIKPANFVQDNQKRIRLVDYGFTKILSRAECNERIRYYGTPFYLPTDDYFDNVNDFQSWQYDVFALMRTLYFPASKGKERTIILTDAIIAAHPILKEYLDTSKYGCFSNISAMALTATLIMVSENIQLSELEFKMIVQQKEIASSIVGIYFSSIKMQLDPQTGLSNIFKLYIVQINQYHTFVQLGLVTHLHMALADDAFMEWIHVNKDNSVRRAGVELFKLGQWGDITKKRLVENPILATYIIYACKKNNTEILTMLLNNKQIVNAVSNLIFHHHASVETILDSILAVPSLFEFFATIKNKNTLNTSLSLLEKGIVDIALFNKLMHSENQQDALVNASSLYYLLNQLGLSQREILILVKKTHLLESCCSAINNQVPAYYIHKMLNHPDALLLYERIKSSSFSVRIYKQITSEYTISLIKWCESLVENFTNSMCSQIVSSDELYRALSIIQKISDRNHSSKVLCGQLVNSLLKNQSDEVNQLIYALYPEDYFQHEETELQLFEHLVNYPNLAQVINQCRIRDNIKLSTDDYKCIILSPKIHQLPSVLLKLTFIPSLDQLDTLMQNGALVNAANKLLELDLLPPENLIVLINNPSFCDKIYTVIDGNHPASIIAVKFILQKHHLPVQAHLFNHLAFNQFLIYIEGGFNVQVQQG